MVLYEKKGATQMKQLNKVNQGEVVTKIEPIKVESDKKVRYAAYVRVSSSSEEQLNSYMQQMSHYVQMFNDNAEKWELTDIYADEGVTGTSAVKRDEFQRMLTDARKGKFDRIITKDLSRFSRDTVVTLSTLRELSALGVTVYFEDENIDSSTVSTEIIMSLHGMSATEASRRISQNGKKGFVARAEAGKYKQGQKLYGYDIVSGQLVTNEDEAKIIQRIFGEYLKGKGHGSIAKGLSGENIKSPTGKQNWNHITIGWILANERYIGDMLLQKTYVTETTPAIKKINKGEKDMYYLEQTHQAIIDTDTFYRTQDLLKKSKLKYSQGTTIVEHPFYKKLLCQCGKKLRQKTNRGKKYWTCRANESGHCDCNLKPIPEESLKKCFVQMCYKLHSTTSTILIDVSNILTRLQVAKSKKNAKLIDINAEIQQLLSDSCSLNSLLIKDVISNSMHAKQQAEISNKVGMLKRSKKQILDDEVHSENLMQTKFIQASLDTVKASGFDKLIFNSLVVKVLVENSDNIIFTLQNNLIFSEKIERGKRWADKNEIHHTDIQQ